VRVCVRERERERARARERASERTRERVRGSFSATVFEFLQEFLASCDAESARETRARGEIPIAVDEGRPCPTPLRERHHVFAVSIQCVCCLSVGSNSISWPLRQKGNDKQVIHIWGRKSVPYSLPRPNYTQKSKSQSFTYTQINLNNLNNINIFDVENQWYTFRHVFLWCHHRRKGMRRREGGRDTEGVCVWVTAYLSVHQTATSIYTHVIHIHHAQMQEGTIKRLDSACWRRLNDYPPLVVQVYYCSCLPPSFDAVRNTLWPQRQSHPPAFHITRPTASQTREVFEYVCIAMQLTRIDRGRLSCIHIYMHVNTHVCACMPWHATINHNLSLFATVGVWLQIMHIRQTEIKIYISKNEWKCKNDSRDIDWYKWIYIIVWLPIMHIRDQDLY